MAEDDPPAQTDAVAEGSAPERAPTEASAPTTALALRPPSALSNTPSFYPEGHAHPGALAAVLSSGPALAIAGGAVGAAIGGLPLGFLAAMVGLPSGWFGTSWYFQSRGKKPLARALMQRALDPVRGDAALEAIAASRRWLPEVRMEAAGLLAFDALERGDVGRAIELLDFDEGDHHLIRRRRNWETGCRGEVLRSILAWLSPGSFTHSGVAPSSAFPPPRDEPEGEALLAALAVLEAVGQTPPGGDEGRVAAAWQDVSGSGLARFAPTLDLIVTAVAAQRLPRLQDELFERLRNDPDGKRRALLRRLFPRIVLPGESGYRGVSEEVVELPDERGPELDAPEAITALATMPESALAPVSRAPVAGIFAAVYGSIFGAGVLLGAITGGPVGAGIGGFLSLLLGIYAAPIPILMGSRTIEGREEARRVAPLLRLQPPPPVPWLKEIATGPPGRLERSSGYRRLPPIPRSQMILHVATARAEAAIWDGRVDDAWAEVAWWFAGARGQIPSGDPMYACGSALIRIAALSGHLAEAERLSGLLEPVDRPWDDLSRRTAHGNASRALGLARALLAAKQGYWEHAASQLSWAGRHRTVWISPLDQTLYAEVARRCQARGLEVTTHGLRRLPELEAWLVRVFPE